MHAMNLRIIQKADVRYHHSNYEGIKSNIFDKRLDSAVSEKEIVQAAKGVNRKSATKCGIPVAMLLAVITPMLSAFISVVI